MPSISPKGGLTFLTDEICPWKIQFSKTTVFYYDRREYNTWNEQGNGWKEDEDESIDIMCYDETKVSDPRRY
jgi:hypothetical protein